MDTTSLNETVCQLLCQSRISSGKSQRDMAKAMNKSVGTIQNWETGIAQPSFAAVISWFDILGLNPVNCLLKLIHPDVSSLSVDDNIDKIRETITSYFKNDASDREIRQLTFCIFGETGSCWSSQLEMITAHNHVPLERRINIAQNVLDNYLLCEARGQLIKLNNILPDTETLKKAIERSKIAAYEGKPGYSVL